MSGSIRSVWVVMAAALLAAGCASRPPAPVVDRSEPRKAEVPVDGYYRVQRGDTLYSVAFRYGLDWRSVGRWNGIGAPYTIYPDQVIRLTEPPPSSAQTRTRPAPVPQAQTRPAPAQHVPTAAPETEREPAPEPAAAAPSGASTEWAWPVQGRVLRGFQAGDPSRNGLDIAGQLGEPVRATAAGEVVYSGDGLIGYGELVIIKHSDRMLSAYAHNQSRNVNEGDRVNQGQVVAELGRNDRREEVLHFEIRRDGKPVNPLEYLPSR